MRKSLTAKLVEHLAAPGLKRLDVWDALLPGFGLRVSPTGRKVWFVMVRPNGHPTRVTLGTYPAISLADARSAGAEAIRNAQGVSTTLPAPVTPTLAATIPLFIQLYAKPKNRGWRATERVLSKFQALFGTPLDRIKRQDVVRVLDELIGSGMEAPFRNS